jgi:hypothetical protein
MSADTSDGPRSKYAVRRKPDNVVRLPEVRQKVVARNETATTGGRKPLYAYVPEAMFGLFDPRDGFLLVLLMRARLSRTRRNDGWIKVPATAFEKIGLANRFSRASIVRRLAADGVLETRRPTPGAALEYRLRPR